MSETDTRFGYNFSWAPSPHGRTTISAQWFLDPSERDAAFRRALIASGYQRPRLWEWWRWGERRPLS